MPARKINDSKPFAYNINLFDKDTYDDLYRQRKTTRLRLVQQTDHWRKLRHEDIVMYFTFQIIRLRAEINRPWYCYYSVTDYGAPGEKEFLCWKTARRARTINQTEAAQYRKYYASCIRKSKEILLWLVMLPSTEYTQTLHHYLLRFIVVPRPVQRQVDAYRKAREAKIARALR
ncbi:MAG: hypothetical protein ACO24H_03555 [Polynucleobacter sp.]